METSTIIKEHRKLAGLTQSELAKAAGVSRPAVAQWESGKTKNLKMSHLFKVAKALNIDPESLVPSMEEDDEPLTPEETKLLELFRALSRSEKSTILKMLGGLSER